MIRLVNARKNYGRQTLYDGVDASINRGERIGLFALLEQVLDLVRQLLIGHV